MRDELKHLAEAVKDSSTVYSRSAKSIKMCSCRATPTSRWQCHRHSAYGSVRMRNRLSMTCRCSSQPIMSQTRTPSGFGSGIWFVVPARPRNDHPSARLRDSSLQRGLAQMSRGKTERAASMAISAIASTLGHLAMDVCMWMSELRFHLVPRRTHHGIVNHASQEES